MIRSARVAGVLALACMTGLAQTKVDLGNQGKGADFSNMPLTKPARSGTVLPSGCQDGEFFFLRGALSGQGLHICQGASWNLVRNDFPSAVGQPDGRTMVSAGGITTWSTGGGDLTGPFTSALVTGLLGRPISQAAPTTGDTLRWNESSGQWEPGGVDTSLVAGLGLLVTGNTILLQDAVVPLYSVGNGAPSGSCTTGRDIYIDTADGQFWFCQSSAQWSAAARDTHTHDATNVVSGILPAARMPEFSGDAVSTAGTSNISVQAIQGKSIQSGLSCSAGQVLTWVAANQQFECQSMAAAQVVGLAASATTDTTNAANITSGALAPARGGTGNESWVPGQCVQVAADGTKLESAEGACAPTHPSKIGTFGALTALTCDASRTGQMAVPSDSPYSLLRCDGAGNWDVFVDGKLVSVPPTSGWTWTNQGTAASLSDGGSWTLQLPTGTGTAQARLMTRAVPAASPYMLDALMRCTAPQDPTLPGGGCGLVWQESSSGKLQTFGLQWDNTATAWRLSVTNRTSATDAGTLVKNVTAAVTANGLWLRTMDTGTMRGYATSTDGRNWVVVYEEERTTTLTPDTWGVFGEVITPGVSGMALNLLHWRVQ